MTQRRKGRERERDGFLGDLGGARAEKRRERASNLLAPSVGLGRPLLLVRSPSLALSPLFHFRAAFEVGEGEGEGEEGKRRRRKRLRESELCSVGNLLRKLFKAPAPAPARSSPRKRLGSRDSGENVASLHAAWPRANREKKRLAITVAC